MFVSRDISIRSLLGDDYADAAKAAACSVMAYPDSHRAVAAADEKVEMYPEAAQRAALRYAQLTGSRVAPPLRGTLAGAATDAFASSQHMMMAPIGGFGCSRVGEDGRLWLLGKSEHYHASLGHAFPGYRIIDCARRLGIPNATHNGARGYATRLCERELVRAVNGDPQDGELETILASKEPKVLNRVINLETGSLAAEAAVKCMLARFYRLDPSRPAPVYEGKTPVFFVMADRSGGSEGNYHGTTVTTQLMRGLWGGMYSAVEKAGVMKVVAVMPNDTDDFKRKLEKYNSGEYKTAGFIHEIVMMNYGAILLTREYLREVYRLCAEYDTPAAVDEIQTGMWYPGMFLHRIYGLKPDFVIIGKGFPGGEYPASKMITTAEYDNLNLFGALVTNGQEELASIAYLVTMTFARDNADGIGGRGEYFASRLRELAALYPAKITAVEGLGHLSALHFATVEDAAAFTSACTEHYLDASAQLYKLHCPPAVLFKPPVTASRGILDIICGIVADILEKMS